MRAHEVLKFLSGLPESTLRHYASVYAVYLSPVPAGRRQREYTEQDARILRLIVEMKAQRVKAADIEATLSSLQAGDWERLPALDDASQALMPTESAVVALQTDKSALQREIEVLHAEHKREIEMLREMLRDATSDRDKLLERLHRAEHLNELYQSGQLKPNS